MEKNILAILSILLIGLISTSKALTDCKENGFECKEFLKSNICGRFVWCYKRDKVDGITNLCTFSDTKYSAFTFKAEGPPVPNPKKCERIDDVSHTCVKICNQLKDTVYPFLGFVNVCLQRSVSYVCKSAKGPEFCGCAQLANGDTLKGKNLQAGDMC